MSYSSLQSHLSSYRKDHIKALCGTGVASWFAERWSAVKDILTALSSDDENKEIAGSYAKGKSDDRIPANVRLDYICGIRREVRKQYFSEEDGIYTDVTPFRHGVISANGANVFDKKMAQILARKEQA